MWCCQAIKVRPLCTPTTCMGMQGRSGPGPRGYGVEIRQVKYFLAIARTGNFSRAAEQVYITQPALSQQIRKLEDELGTPLFERHQHGASLTPAGVAFYGYALSVTEQTERIKARLNRIAEAGPHSRRMRLLTKGNYKDF